MQMRILVPDTASAAALADRLTVALGSGRISFPRGPREVDVLIGHEPDSTVLRILDAVQRWLDQARIGSVELRLGERSYSLARPSPSELWR